MIRIIALLILVVSSWSTAFAQETFDANTEVQVCFDVNHSYVSDLGFYLIGPQECGSPVVALSPYPQSVDVTNGCCCNQGNDLDSLCFSISGDSILNVCEQATPLSGTFEGYASSDGPIVIDWSPLYGCPIESGSWRAQVFDCIGADVGWITAAYLDISGTNSSYVYPIASVNDSIFDNSCTHETASLVQFGTDSILNSIYPSLEVENLKYEYNTKANSFRLSGIEPQIVTIQLYDLGGRMIQSAQVTTDTPMQLIPFHGVAILTASNSHGLVLLSAKIIRP